MAGIRKPNTNFNSKIEEITLTHTQAKSGDHFILFLCLLLFA
jgi:hypothetical protein